MMTKLSRIDSSSSSLKYSIMTCIVSREERARKSWVGEKYLNNFVQKEDDFDGIRVAFGKG